MTPSSTTSPGPQVRLTPAISQQPTPGEVRGGPQLAQDRPVSRLRIDTRTYWNQWLKTLEPPVAATPGGSRLNPLQTGSDVKAPPGGGRIWCDNYSPDWVSLRPEPSHCPELLIESQMAYDCRDVSRQMERDGVQVLVDDLPLYRDRLALARKQADPAVAQLLGLCLDVAAAKSSNLKRAYTALREVLSHPLVPPEIRQRLVCGKDIAARDGLVMEALTDLADQLLQQQPVEVAPVPAGQIAPDTVRFDALCPITGT